MAEKAKTPLQAVKEQMEAITKQKGTELAQIESNLATAQDEVKEAAAAMQEATERMNGEGYEEAKARKRKAQTACEMYQTRKAQLENPEHYISDEDSNKVIQSLMAYEDTLAEGFKEQFAEALKHLDKILWDYDAAVHEVETTMLEWTTRVHANYISSTTTWLDPETGEHTNRSAKPVPVRSTNYTGCKEANTLREYIQKAKALCNR